MSRQLFDSSLAGPNQRSPTGLRSTGESISPPRTPRLSEAVSSRRFRRLMSSPGLCTQPGPVRGRRHGTHRKGVTDKEGLVRMRGSHLRVLFFLRMVFLRKFPTCSSSGTNGFCLQNQFVPQRSFRCSNCPSCDVKLRGQRGGSAM